MPLTPLESLERDVGHVRVEELKGKDAEGGGGNDDEVELAPGQVDAEAGVGVLAEAHDVPLGRVAVDVEGRVDPAVSEHVEHVHADSGAWRDDPVAVL